MIKTSISIGDKNGEFIVRLKIIILTLLTMFLLSACDTNVTTKIEPSPTESNVSPTLQIQNDEKLSPAPSPSNSNDSNSEDQLKSSEDDIDYLNSAPISMDFNGDGIEETLSLEISDLPEKESTNKPIRIKMMIAESEFTYESGWNDGVSLHITDFNSKDSFIDIYIVSYGTDVSANVDIFRYDGTQVIQYAQFYMEEVLFAYDAIGKIFFKGFIDGEFLNAELDYNNNVIIPITAP